MKNRQNGQSFWDGGSKSLFLCPMDLISCLPDNLIETILLKLPVRDAARTCILSTRWRYCWVKLPQLFLDFPFWEQIMHPDLTQSAARLKFNKIISHILLTRHGSITHFRLEVPKYRSFPEIDTFIGFLARNGVQKFELEMELAGDYALPSSLFTCPTLITLDIRTCKINLLPSSFRGLSLLTELTLADVLVSVEALETLVSSCPSLQILQLALSIDIQYLEFNIPKLDKFLYYYSFSTQSSLLPLNKAPKQTICKLFDGLPSLRSLSLDNHSLESLIAGGVPTILPTPLLHLSSIDLFKIRLEVEDKFSSVLYLIKSSPNLEKFRILIEKTSSVTHNLQGPEDDSHLTHNHLVEVTVEGIVGARAEMKLIKLLLAKSPALRKMRIKLDVDKASEVIKIMNELFMFKHASSDVNFHLID